MLFLDQLLSGPLLAPSIALLAAAVWACVSIFASVGGGHHGLGDGGGEPGSLTDAGHGGAVHGDIAGTDAVLADGAVANVDIGHASLDTAGGASAADGGMADGSLSHWNPFWWLQGAVDWMNFGKLPLTVWLAFFALGWWLVSVAFYLLLDRFVWPEPSPLLSAALTIRNLVVAALPIKLMTSPLKNLESSEHVGRRSIVGAECEISSSEATPTFGLVRFKTDGAPLLLNVRTDGAYLAKGTKVWITHFDRHTKRYVVSAIDPVGGGGKSVRG